MINRRSIVCDLNLNKEYRHVSDYEDDNDGDDNCQRIFLVLLHLIV